VIIIVIIVFLNRTYVINHGHISFIDIIENEKEVLLGLLDILFAFAYNNRTTTGENTVESSWTIARLSPTLSWFDVSYPEPNPIVTLRNHFITADVSSISRFIQHPRRWPSLLQPEVFAIHCIETGNSS